VSGVLGVQIGDRGLGLRVQGSGFRVSSTGHTV
jgi:hypothetical protein